MNKIREIVKKVITYSDFPREEVKKQNLWIDEYPVGCFVECHLDDDEDDEISLWILENYPELQYEDSFLIEIDTD